MVKASSKRTYFLESSSPYKLVKIISQSSKCDFLTRQEHKDKGKITKFISLDIETYLNEKGEHIPFAAGFIRPGSIIPDVYYDNGSSDRPVLDLLLDDLLTPKNSHHYIFAHNMGKYDGF